MNDFIDPHAGKATRPHPAKFSRVLIAHIEEMLPDRTTTICDPMAGVGQIMLLGEDYEYHLNELESEWAEQIYEHAMVTVTVGDAKNYQIPDGCVIVTSPPYGNRMADFFVSKTRPESMKGRYAGDLGRKLTDDSTASKKFGGSYMEMMEGIYKNIFSQMVEGQYFILNVSNFIRSYKEVNVIGFYLSLFAESGFTLDDMRAVVTPRDRGRGANANLRVKHEVLLKWRKL